MKHRITRVRIHGLRSLERLELELGGGLNVIIGENGSGKSSIVEAIMLLRRAATPTFFADLQKIHGGFGRLCRFGATTIELGADVEADDGSTLSYDISFDDGAILREVVKLRSTRAQEPFRQLVRTGKGVTAVIPQGAGFSTTESNAFDTDPTQTALYSVSARGVLPTVRTIQRAIESIDVQVPFEVTPRWVAQAFGRKSEMRTAQENFRTTALLPLGTNIAAAYDALLKESSVADWEFSMDLVRLGLGEWVERVVPRTDDANQISLWLKVAGRDQWIQPSGISDGQLSYLALVALTRLHALRAPGALLVFDEPELHLHPRMMMRVLGLFDRLAERTPVLLATHSRRMLDTLSKPARQVTLLELEQPTLKTRIMRPDDEALAAWLTEYEDAGLGRLLDEGLGDAIMREPKIRHPPKALARSGTTSRRARKRAKK